MNPHVISEETAFNLVHYARLGFPSVYYYDTSQSDCVLPFKNISKLASRSILVFMALCTVNVLSLWSEPERES